MTTGEITEAAEKAAAYLSTPFLEKTAPATRYIALCVYNQFKFMDYDALEKIAAEALKAERERRKNVLQSK